MERREIQFRETVGGNRSEGTWRRRGKLARDSVEERNRFNSDREEARGEGGDLPVVAGAKYRYVFGNHGAVALRLQMH